jgi:hexosaminidase
VKKKYFGVMVDCSRNAVLNLSAVKRLIDALSKMGYNMLMLYTEDTYEIDGQPLFGYLRGRYTKDELKEIVAYGKEKGIELIPCMQTLAHLNQMFRWNEYSDINDCDDILLVGEEKTYALIEDMVKTLRECFDSDLIHIGMDEAHNLGKGKYKQLHGERNRFDILKEHLEKVQKIVEKYNFTPIMWSDMFFRLASGGEYYIEDASIINEEATSSVPKNMQLTYWDYYSNSKQHYDSMIEGHQKFSNPLWFAGGAHTWEGLTPHNIPSIDRTIKAMQSCRDKNVDNIFLTCWGDDGGETSVFGIIPALFYAAEIRRGNEDEKLIKERFLEIFGISFDDFIKLDLPAVPNEDYKHKITCVDCTLLYADPFIGWMDSAIKTELPDVKSAYEKNRDLLLPLAKNPDFGYLFKAAAALCDLISKKAQLGINTRAAYLNGDRDALSAMLSEYDEASESAEKFYEAYRDAWLYDKKGSGFEVMDIRIGGVIRRLSYCKKRIEDYLSGKIPEIDELNDKMTDFEFSCWHRWRKTVTVGNLTWL